jgi:ABC-type glycerol-3-phosphate transport system substrate-binding protein
MNKIKRMTGIILILSMLAMTISGCGQNVNVNANNQGEDGATEATLPEFTYVPEYKEVKTEGYLDNVHMTENGFYYIDESYPTEQYSKVEGELPEEMTEEEAYQSSYKLCFFDYASGEISKQEIIIEDGERVRTRFFGPNNKMILITEKSVETDANFTSDFYINEFDLETMEVKRVDITEDFGKDHEYLYIEFIQMDSEGNLYLASGDVGVWVFDKEYKLQKLITLDSYINSMAMTKDGDLVIAKYADNGDYVLQKYNKESQSFGEASKVDFYVYSQKGMIAGVDSDLIVKTDSGLSTYSFEDNMTKEIVNWINSDMNGDVVENFIVLEDGRILLLSHDWSDEDTSYELVYLTKTKTSELPEKKLVSIKTLYLASDLKNRIIDFNKNNTEYRVVVETYDTTDYEAAETKYKTDLATGNASDIIDLESANIKELASKGILEDLYTYIDADPELNRDDFFENVLDAYSVDGKLTAVFTSVGLQTMIAKTKFVGEEQGWTPAQIVELKNSLPEDAKLLEYGSKNDVLDMLVNTDLSSYIDWNTGECKFNSEDFMNLMKFANGFPTEEEYQEMFEGENFDFSMMNSQDLITSDKLILVNGYFSSIADYQSTMARFKEDAICIGYPSVGGTGTYMIASGTPLGINADSTQKEGAWEFISYYLSEEAAEDTWGIPINKASFEKKIQEAMTVQYYTEEEIKEGWVWVPEDQQRISEDGKIEKPVTSVYFGDKEDYIYAPTQEIVEEFTKIFTSTKSVSNYNKEVMAIIKEEADGYFSGQKSVEDVANIIQSRLQIYINENK